MALQTASMWAEAQRRSCNEETRKNANSLRDELSQSDDVVESETSSDEDVYDQNDKLATSGLSPRFPVPKPRHNLSFEHRPEMEHDPDCDCDVDVMCCMCLEVDPSVKDHSKGKVLRRRKTTYAMLVIPFLLPILAQLFYCKVHVLLSSNSDSDFAYWWR